jgi:hypothetical protein
MTTVGHHMTESENAMRNRRKGSYHLVSSRNKLPTDPEEEDEDQLFRFLTSTSNKMLRQTENFLLIQGNKAQLLRELASSGGDTTTQAFQDALGMLTKVYDPTHFDARKIPSRPSSSSRKRNENRSPQMEGMWIDVTKPKFSGSLGMNENHDYLYTLGRMSFGTSIHVLSFTLLPAVASTVNTLTSPAFQILLVRRYFSPYQTGV